MTAAIIEARDAFDDWTMAERSATDWAGERGRQQAGGDREVRRDVRSLKRELQRKEKALAPATARRAG